MVTGGCRSPAGGDRDGALHGTRTLSALSPVRRQHSTTFAEAVQYVTDSASRASGRTVVGVDVHNRSGRLWAVTRQGLRERLDDVLSGPVDPVVVATSEGPLYFMNFAIRQRSAMDDEVVDEDLGLP